MKYEVMENEPHENSFSHKNMKSIKINGRWIQRRFVMNPKERKKINIHPISSHRTWKMQEFESWIVNTFSPSRPISFLVWMKFIISCKRNLTTLRFFDGERERNLWIYFDFLWFSCQHKSSCLEGNCFFALTQDSFIMNFVCNLCVCCIS